MNPRKHSGFTLIELMIVVAIMAILSTIAIPAYHDMVVQAQMKEALGLAENLKPSLEERFTRTQSFPRDNAESGLPAADKLIGNYVKRIEVDEGAMHITLGNKVHAAAAGKILTIRPIVVSGSPQSPISWICGDASVPEGMKAVGENRTDVPTYFLPLRCRL